jgi:hypothetical protein
MICAKENWGQCKNSSFLGFGSRFKDLTRLPDRDSISSLNLSFIILREFSRAFSAVCLRTRDEKQVDRVGAPCVAKADKEPQSA